MIKQPRPSTELREALLALGGLFRQAVFFSVFTNFLALTPTVYMMQVYGRVLDSRNYTTLAMLTLLVVMVYVFMEVLDWARAEILHRASLKLDQQLNDRVFNVSFYAKLRGAQGGPRAPEDMRALRDFLSSPVLLAVLDAPISLLFMILIYLINPLMGFMTAFGAVVQILLAFMTEKGTQKLLVDANRGSASAQSYAHSSLRNAEAIEAMGMLDSIHARWLEKQRQFLLSQAVASDRAGISTALSKFVQITLGSALLGLGAWLTVKGAFLDGGSMMLVASILGGRAVAPITQVITQWKLVVGARDAYERLGNLLGNIPEKPTGMSLPAPRGHLSVEAVTASAPGSPLAIIRGITFVIPAGDIIAMIGPSASGKSTLARLLVGIWPSASGKIRLDGVDVFTWNKAELGPHIGYLPQDVELFDGSLAENIARFGAIDRDKVEAAARQVGLHDVIMALPEGYDAQIGEEGCFLSGGQRQRVGLARAIYGAPQFIVLDEPNSSLDEAGEAALLDTLRWLKAEGKTVVVITHRASVFPAVDRILLLRDGAVHGYGVRDEILAALSGQQQAAPPAVAPARAAVAA
jgi:ATP-binding cassette subfamily C exporter for protease/lipase